MLISHLHPRVTVGGERQILLFLKLEQKASQSVLCKVVIKGKVKHIKFDNNFVFYTWYYSVINIYPRNVKTLKKKNYKKKITDIGEDFSVCDEQETSANENDMETHEKLFTIESELNIINKRLRKDKKERNYR